jgi:hypothetical protein
MHMDVGNWTELRSRDVKEASMGFVLKQTLDSVSEE